MAGVAGVFGASLFSAMHGSLVTSSLVRETTESESPNAGYKFGQEEETYNIVAGESLENQFAKLIFPFAHPPLLFQLAPQPTDTSDASSSNTPPSTTPAPSTSSSLPGLSLVSG